MDKWIITGRRFKEHATFEAAEAELYRLQMANPKKNFRIHRIKTQLTSDGAVGRLIGAVKRLLDVHPVPAQMRHVANFRQRVDQVLAEEDVREALREVDPTYRDQDFRLKEAAQ